MIQEQALIYMIIRNINPPIPGDEKHHKRCNYSLNRSPSLSHPLSIHINPCMKQSSVADHTAEGKECRNKQTKG